MKKVIILKKIRVTMKSFAPPSFNHFSPSLNRKKRVVMRAMRKKLNIFTLELSSYYIRIGNLNKCKCGHCKNEARKIDCFCCREVWMQCLLVRQKSQSNREESHHTTFMGNCPTSGHTC